MSQSMWLTPLSCYINSHTASSCHWQSATSILALSGHNQSNGSHKVSLKKTILNVGSKYGSHLPKGNWCTVYEPLLFNITKHEQYYIKHGSQWRQRSSLVLYQSLTLLYLLSRHRFHLIDKPTWGPMPRAWIYWWGIGVGNLRYRIWSEFQ